MSFCFTEVDSNALDKTGCSISRLYPDMRSWQRLGVELRGQRNRRVIRYAKPRGKAESASTKAERNKG
jgi:hypothetical protein